MPLSTKEIAQRIAMDLPDGCCVNLGVGIPTLVAGYLPKDKEVILQSENGILGMGPPQTKEKKIPISSMQVSSPPHSLRELLFLTHLILSLCCAEDTWM